MLNKYCSDFALAGILHIFQNIVNVVQIVVPIVLLISLSVQLTQMVINPEEKKNMKKLYNTFIAAVVIFFIPMLVNMTIGMIDSNSNFLKCWRDAKTISFDVSKSKYISNGKDAVKIVQDYDYEKGDEKASDSSTGSNSKDVEGFMTAVRNTVNYAREHNYHYGDSHAVPPTTDGLISCDRLAAKALWDIGYTDQRKGGEVVSTLDRYLTSHGWIKSTNINDAKYGSIIIVSHGGVNGSPYHAFVVNSYKNGHMTTYDEGAEWRVHANQPFDAPYWNQSLIYGVYNMV